MTRRRLSKRHRIEEQIGRDPGAAIYELVYLQNKTLEEAGHRFGVNQSTAMRWLRDWQKQHALIAAEVA